MILIDSITNNVSYHQRFLEQYLVYLKRCVYKDLHKPRNFKFDEFELPKSDVEEEINEFKVKHDLKLYDDKKHFICSEISNYCYQCVQF